jgi:hypothetical protein
LAGRRLRRYWRPRGVDGDLLLSSGDAHADTYGNADTDTRDADAYTDGHGYAYGYAQSNTEATPDSAPSSNTLIPEWSVISEK